MKNNFLLLLLLLLLTQQTNQQQQQTKQPTLNSFNQLLNQQSKTCPATTNTITTTHTTHTTTTANNNNQKPKLLSFSDWKQQQHQQQQPVDENKNISQPTPSTWSSTLSQSLSQTSKRATDYLKTTISADSLLPICQPEHTPLKTNLSEPHQAKQHSIKLNQQHPPILYQPDPNTGTGTPDDPLKILSTRTNYASFDCSASIHRSSKHTKSPSSILNEKKDKYLLTPCTNHKSKQHNNFVVFELCDEIEIDHVVLANFEFFSSMFKLIKMSVSNSGLEGVGRAEWVDVGFLKTHNTRGFQVFPIKHLKGFYRYVRLDFLTHYGSEYYCPLSLVRIYGLTQIDAYRRDEKLEQRNKVDESVIQAQEQDQEESVQEEQQQQLVPNSEELLPLPQQPELPIQTDNKSTTATSDDPADDHPSADSNIPSPAVQERSNEAFKSNEEEKDLNQNHIEKQQDQSDSPEATTTPDLVVQLPETVQPEPTTNQESPPSAHDSQSTSTQPVLPSPSSEPDILPAPSDPPQPQDDYSLATDTEKIPLPPPAQSSDSQEHNPTTESNNHNPVETTTSESIPNPPASSAGRGGEAKKQTLTGHDPTHPTKPIISSSKSTQAEKPTPPLHHNPPAPGNPTGHGSESIFGQIMKRLNALESNHLLLLKYTEDQVLGLGDSSLKVQSHLDELEKILKLRTKTHEESVEEIQGIKNQMTVERNFLNHRIESLDSSITFIKRIGLVQFLSIIAILIFLSMTRIQHGSSPTNGRMTREERRGGGSHPWTSHPIRRLSSSPRLLSEHPSLRHQRTPGGAKKLVVGPRRDSTSSATTAAKNELFLVSSLHRKLAHHSSPRLPSLKLGLRRPDSPLRRAASLSHHHHHHHQKQLSESLNGPAYPRSFARRARVLEQREDQKDELGGPDQAVSSIDDDWVKDDDGEEQFPLERPTIPKAHHLEHHLARSRDADDRPLEQAATVAVREIEASSGPSEEARPCAFTLPTPPPSSPPSSPSPPPHLQPLPPLPLLDHSSSLLPTVPLLPPSYRSSIRHPLPASQANSSAEPSILEKSVEKPVTAHLGQ
ncbi:hypothetical protein PGT21_006683 [Puccinia graminis f. sp. tritici]|uniref:SUN domain-containing protein n=1 Tax=Puccinia graminis f. sp. tritici TaxID=56615 RepID=A0A5B0N9X6_PUCGR|nr:hypothetical protein PGT21_006683 [Puccinia graminis f. sp. tritici]KAA1118386.1 hypothetical protein PGTUg99_006454 [Puccinia graminis f. sp. tritici]